MKKKTNIRTLLRTMVREEVAMAIQEVITELKQPVTTKQVSQPKTKKKIVEKKSFTSNSVLNEGAEVELKVKKTNDHLVIELISDLGSKNVDKQHLNIIV